MKSESSGNQAATIDQATAQQIAAALGSILEQVGQQLDKTAKRSSTAQALESHLGAALNTVVSVSTDLPVWHHVSAHRGVAAYLVSCAVNSLQKASE